MKLIFFKRIIIGVLVGALATVTLLLVFSAVLCKQNDPNKLMRAFSVISLLAGAFVCGKVSAIGIDDRRLSGVFSGVCFSVVVFVLSIIFSEIGIKSLLKIVAIVILAVAGAMLGKKNKNVMSSKRRKNIIKRYAKT